jgi:hypothetical protein
MNKTPDTLWERIDTTAATLGVKYDARRKWKERGVPHRWRLPLIQASGGHLTANDFDRPRNDGGAS